MLRETDWKVMVEKLIVAARWFRAYFDEKS